MTGFVHHGERVAAQGWWASRRVRMAKGSTRERAASELQMSDFAPVDGRGGWGATPGSPVSVASGSGAAVRGAGQARRAVEVASPLAAPARRIVDEVELSDEAQRVRPAREDIIAQARERIASGYYDSAEVVDRTIDR